MSTKRKASDTPPVDVKAPQEVTVGKRSTPDMKTIGGSGFEVWDSQLLCRTAATASPLLQVGDDAAAPQRRNAGVAALALHAFAPQDPVEAMIAAQATALHFATMECSRRAMIQGQSPDVASKLRKDAANSARAMVEMTEALQRRRGKGPQTIRVERVVVQDGGQAVVAGSVVTSAPYPAVAPPAAAIGQGQAQAPMDLADTAPVAMESARHE